VTEDEYVVTARTPSMSAPGFYVFHSKKVAEHWAASIRSGGGEASVRPKAPESSVAAGNRSAYDAVRTEGSRAKDENEVPEEDDRRREQGEYHWVAGYRRADGKPVRSHVARNPRRGRR
jgi:hypothetical protein